MATTNGTAGGRLLVFGVGAIFFCAKSCLCVDSLNMATMQTLKAVPEEYDVQRTCSLAEG